MSKKLFTEKEIEIFEECGFNIDILGMKRVESSGKRWRSAFRRNGITQLQDTRKFNNGRPSEKYKLKNKVSYFCELSGVSRSGYYNYFSSKSISKRDNQESKDLESYKNILAAFNFKSRKKGARQMKMTLSFLIV